MKNFVYVGLCLVLLSFVSCATVDYSVVNPDANVASARKVAVFPFIVEVNDYAAFRVSGAREEASSLVTSIFVKELARKTRYEIISPEKADIILSIDKPKMDWINKGFFGDVYEKRVLTTERLRALGSQLNADAILVGKITEFARFQQNGSRWTGVGLEIKMVDVKSGELLWEARDKIKQVSTITHGNTSLEANMASYPVVAGGVDKEPKYRTGQGYCYAKPGDFPYHISYKKPTQKVCRNIISTLPRY